MELGSLHYALIVVGIILLIISLEWDKIKNIKIDLKKVIVVLIVIFFLGTALASLFR